MNNPVLKNDISLLKEAEVFALFGNQAATLVIFKHLRPLPDGDIYQPYAKFRNPDIKTSLEAAVISSRQAYGELFGRWDDSRNYIYAAFADNQANINATGKSAGLAFALKFALYLHYKPEKAMLPFRIAATGELVHVSADEKISKVGHINDKIKAALTVLSAGDKIFYPRSNHKEIEKALRQEVEARNIELYPVETLKEAIKKLLDPSPPPPKPKFCWVCYTLLTLLLLALLYLLIPVSVPCNQKTVTDLLENGEFEKAQTLCNEWSSPDSAAFSELCNLPPLEIDLTFAYFEDVVDNSGALREFPFSAANLAGLLLGLENPYYFEALSTQGCFLYLFQVDSYQDVDMIFPMADAENESHRLYAEALTNIPTGDNAFALDDSTNRGEVTFYAFASPWRAMDVENAFAAFERDNSPGKRTRFKNLIKQIRRREKAEAAGIFPVYFEKAAFLQK